MWVATLGLIPATARDLILAGAILSIMLNPLAFAAVDLVKSRFDSKAQTGTTGTPVKPDEDLPLMRLMNHIVLVGHGRVGSIVSEVLVRKGRDFLVVEDASSRIAFLRDREIEVIPAHAAKAETA